MPRFARVVAPGLPHYVTQRGNRSQPTFFSDDDYRQYLALMGESSRLRRVQIWAYCVMPNHVHLVALPATADGLCRAIGEAHRRYTLGVNTREGWRGHLWQGRFRSYALDETHLVAAVRHVEQHPVRAGLVAEAGEYRWSSAAAHLAGRDDGLVTVAPLRKVFPDWRAFLAERPTAGEVERLRGHERSGRPLGSEAFLERLERALGVSVRPRKPGRPRRLRPNLGPDRGVDETHEGGGGGG